MRKSVQTTMAVALMALAPIASARFVSTDPEQANPNTGQNFNRYHYANNNPYKFTDPDGRAARIVHEEGRMRVEMPTRFTGPGATPGNISTVTTGFESQSGVYNVNGQPTQVDFKITEITRDTPRGLRNEVKMFDGPTDHPAGTGGNYADSLGGTKVSLDVTSQGFQYGVGEHEINHLGGADDAYTRNASGMKVPDPSRAGDIMNQLPGRMTDIGVNEIMREPKNQHIGN
ncbi:hypothetical protein [Luteimonas sp. R10]|uniref:hypothetical protein n=1 Tax=Luteimonas sp. R10 TaxID=3108176 RepID=UPI0030884D8A|nr:hypothetical protein U3649_15170 [Luteimonas sp. R10]